jgi:hypothetical protein
MTVGNSDEESSNIGATRSPNAEAGDADVDDEPFLNVLQSLADLLQECYPAASPGDGSAQP